MISNKVFPSEELILEYVKKHPKMADIAKPGQYVNLSMFCEGPELFLSAIGIHLHFSPNDSKTIKTVFLKMVYPDHTM